MKEGVVLQRADLVRGVDGLAAPQAGAVHIVGLKHGHSLTGSPSLYT